MEGDVFIFCPRREHIISIANFPLNQIIFSEFGQKTVVNILQTAMLQLDIFS